MSHHHERIVCEFCKDVILQCRCPEPKVDIPKGYCQKCQKLRKGQAVEVSLAEYEKHVASMTTPNGSSTMTDSKLSSTQKITADIVGSPFFVPESLLQQKIKEALDAERRRAEEAEKTTNHWFKEANEEHNLRVKLESALSEARNEIERIKHLFMITTPLSEQTTTKLLSDKIESQESTIRKMKEAFESIKEWSDCYCMTEEESSKPGGITCPTCISEKVLNFE